MKLQLPTEYWQKRGPPPPIFYKAEPTLGKTPTEKSDPLKVDIKTQPGERDSEMVVIYVPLFITRIPEAILKFITLLNKIIRVQALSIGPQKFGITSNLAVG